MDEVHEHAEACDVNSNNTLHNQRRHISRAVSPRRSGVPASRIAPLFGGFGAGLWIAVNPPSRRRLPASVAGGRSSRSPAGA